MSRIRKASRDEELSPALFPFLAVLLCTMGALVLVLVLVVGQASAAAKQSLETEKEKLLEVSDVVELVSEEMLARREKQQQAIDGKRSQLAAIEDHIDRLMKELAELETLSKAFENRSTSNEQLRRDQQNKLAETEKKLREAQSEFEAERAALAAKPPAFAIIPYQGKSGTTRRPIYLECTAIGVVIQPEGVLISLEDLKPPHGPGNPLDAALRAIRTSYQRLDPSASSMVSPYPLLLVRPDGIRSYVLARAAMTGWDDQFGYELIDQNMPLAFPPSVPGLKPQLLNQLEAARQRQAALIAAMPRRYASDSVWEDALEDVGRDPTEGLGGGGNESTRYAANDWSTIDEEVGRSEGMASEWKMVQELPRGASPGPSSSVESSNTNPATGGMSSHTSGMSAEDAKLFAESQAAQTATAGNGPNASPLGQLSNSAGPSDPVAVGATPANSNSSLTPSSPTGQTGDEIAMRTLPGGSSMNQSVGQQANAMNRQPAEALNPSADDNLDKTPPNQVPSVNVPIASKNRNIKESASNKPPPLPTWTTRRRVTKGTAVSRPMTVVVMPDRWFVMKDDRPDQVEKVITLQLGPAYARETLETTINDRIDSWGVAVAGGHWEPKLQIQVAPHAELSAQRLQKIMEGSGFEIEWQQLK